MNKFATVEVLKNGEIRIPREIRSDLDFKAGTRLLVLEGRDNIVLKKISGPSFEERFDDLTKETRSVFKKLKTKKRDLTAAIQKIRSKT